MNFSIKKVILAVVFLTMSMSSLFSITLKVGSIAPRNSPWDKTLRAIGGRWNEISGGQVSLKIYPGGIAGAEGDMLRKVKLGALDGAVLSSMGLNKISPDLLVLTMPFVVKSKPELDYVMGKIEPTYEKIMEKKKFKLVGWTMAGWMKIFSRNPVVYPKDLMKQKLGFTSGEEALTHLLRNLGFHVVPSDTIDWLSSLQSGRIDALLISPLIAAAYQVFTLADNMLDYPISPLLGAIVFSDRAWRKIPARYHDEFLTVVSEEVKKLDIASKELDDRAFQLLLRNGLNVTEATPEIDAVWTSFIEKAYRKEGIIGTVISRDIFDEATGYAAEYRKQHGTDN